MKSVVHIVNAMEIGGVEVGVLSLLKSNKSNYYKVIAIKGCDKQVYDSLTTSEKNRLYICNGLLEAIFLTIRLKPKYIVSSLWRSHFVSFLMKIILFYPKRIHFVHSTSFAHIVDKIITKISVITSDYIICDSLESKSWLQESVWNKSSFVTPMNISFSNQCKQPNLDVLTFVYVGRYSKEKNIYSSIDFIAELNANGLEVKFDLYGRDDGELNNLISYVDSKSLKNSVRFYGSVCPTKIEEVMRKYNYYIQSSYSEGMAISVFQAINSGLLPVVNPVGEIKKYTKNELNAFYLDIDSIKRSSSYFCQKYKSGEMNNYRTGYILNRDDYPVFDKMFFSTITNIIDTDSNRNRR